MNDQNLEFYLPEGAEIDQSQAQTAGGQWVESAAVPQKEKGRYAFVFPLRPGATQFQVSYHLPYSGSAKIDPKPLYPMEHFVIVLPQSIQFLRSKPDSSRPRSLPSQDAVAQVAVNVHPGQSLAFSISGDGVLQSQNSSGGGAMEARLSSPRLRLPTADPAAGWDRRSKLPIRWKNIAGLSWAGSLWCWLQARFTWQSARRPRAFRILLPPKQEVPAGRANCQSRNRSASRLVARSLERRAIRTGNGAQARQDHATGVRESQSGAGSDPGTGAEAREERVWGGHSCPPLLTLIFCIALLNARSNHRINTKTGGQESAPPHPHPLNPPRRRNIYI